MLLFIGNKFYKAEMTLCCALEMNSIKQKGHGVVHWE